MTRIRKSRRGFTLIELMIVVSLLGIIGSMLTAILVRQQRFHRAVTNITDARARMRDVATIMPTDLRGISTAAHDILALSDTSIQFRAFIGAAVLCNFPSGTVIEIPPKTLASGNVLSSWINTPSPNDIVYLYDDGLLAGNADDSWDPYLISDTTSAANSAWCPSTNTIPFTTAADNAARRYRLTLATAGTGTFPPQYQTPNGWHIRMGAPIRFAREVRYSIYAASDGQWYIGYQRCTPDATYGNVGACGTREVLAGPVRPGTADTTSSGLFFVYYNRLGTRLTALSNTDTIALINVGIRTNTESLLKATTKTGGSIATSDSIRFSVGLRNRI
jgi:prepilin-type N-terminal cleavage/methylation domain-containing protein